MRKILGFVLGVYAWIGALSVQASEKFEVLPDLPEPLAAAQASSVSTVDNTLVSTQSVGAEPNFFSVIFSLVFVVILIYATGILYTKLNKVGLKTLKKQMGDGDSSKVSVVSTTPLGNNKTLHVVELDGKRMLIGASANGIHLIKDLGTYPPTEFEETEFSKIEIPNIRIPKIEIPKIEFPNIGFTKTSKKIERENEFQDSEKESEGFEISDIYEETPDGIIDKLFTQEETRNEEAVSKPEEPAEEKNTHIIDPDEYALYKKYL